jgi:hypothetical protein
MDGDLDMIPFTVNEIRRLWAINTAPDAPAPSLACLTDFISVPFCALPPSAIPHAVGKARAVQGRGGGYPAAAAGAGERSPAPASAIVRERMGDGLNPLTMR